jgi:hypothetical protein
VRQSLPDTFISDIGNSRVTEMLQQTDQLKQVRRSEVRSPSRQCDKRIGCACVCPARRQRFKRTFLIVKKYPVLSPGLAHSQQLEAVSEQRVEWMDDCYKLPFTIITVCS